jgi:hypothetical protein
VVIRPVSEWDEATLTILICLKLFFVAIGRLDGLDAAPLLSIAHGYSFMCIVTQHAGTPRRDRIF